MLLLVWAAILFPAATSMELVQWAWIDAEALERGLLPQPRNPAFLVFQWGLWLSLAAAAATPAGWRGPADGPGWPSSWPPAQAC